MIHFLDPLDVIKHYKSWPIWQLIEMKNINGMHDSLVDAKAQTHIVTHKYFVPSINKSKSIHSIGDIFSKSACTNMTKKMEPSSDAHH